MNSNSTILTAKEKYGFTDQEIVNYLILTKNDLQILEKVAKRLAKKFSNSVKKIRNELSTLLGIDSLIWETAERETYTKDIEHWYDDFRYRQVGKYVIINVVSHILVEYSSFKQDPGIALTKIKLAINLFEPLPDLPMDGMADDVHKEAANQITRKEIRRIEELLDVRDLSGNSGKQK